MGREIRRVPANWDHPQEWQERQWPTAEIKLDYRPMHQRDYDQAVIDYEAELAEWLEGQRRWHAGEAWDYKTEMWVPREQKMAEYLDWIESDRAKYGYSADYKVLEARRYQTGICSYADVAGKIPTHPDPDDYMPTGPWYQLYETVSEGTPLTPPFATEDELVEHLSSVGDHRGYVWDRTAAASMVGGVWSPTMMMNATGLHQPEDPAFWKDTN